MTYIYIIWETADMGVKPGGPGEHIAFWQNPGFRPKSRD